MIRLKCPRDLLVRVMSALGESSPAVAASSLRGYWWQSCVGITAPRQSMGRRQKSPVVLAHKLSMKSKSPMSDAEVVAIWGTMQKEERNVPLCVVN